MSLEERFTRAGRGKWTFLVVSQGKRKELPAPGIDRLVSHGVSRARAEAIVDRIDAEYVEKVLEYFDERVAGKRGQVKSAGAWLASAFKRYEEEGEELNFGDFESSHEKRKRAQERRLLAESEKEAKDASELAEQVREGASRYQISRFLSALGDEERKHFERSAVEASPKALRDAYERMACDPDSKKGSAWKSIRRQVISDHIERCLRAREEDLL